MIESIFNFLKEFIIYLKLKREDNLRDEEKSTKRKNELKNITKSGTLSELFKFLKK